MSSFQVKSQTGIQPDFPSDKNSQEFSSEKSKRKFRGISQEFSKSQEFSSEKPKRNFSRISQETRIPKEGYNTTDWFRNCVGRLTGKQKRIFCTFFNFLGNCIMCPIAKLKAIICLVLNLLYCTLGD